MSTVFESFEIDLTDESSQQLYHLYKESDLSDVTFVIDGTKLPSHKLLLAAKSSYFRALFYDGFKETTQNEIELKDIRLEAFKALLKFAYTGRMTLVKMDVKDVIDILGLADLYYFDALKLSISNCLVSSLSLGNCCAIFEAAIIYNLKEMQNICMTFIDYNSTGVLHHSTFKTLSQDSLCTLLQRDSFYAPEIEIFKAVNDWYRNNPKADIQAVASFVRLPLIDYDGFWEIVRPSGIFDSDQLLDAIKQKMTLKFFPCRAGICRRENVSSEKYNAKVVCGDFESFLLNDNTTNYDMEQGYTRHSINDTNDQYITIKLGKIEIINRMKILLWDKDDRLYSYYIEISIDQKNWQRIIDHTNYHDRTWQFFYFSPRAVRYIKIVGTHSTKNNDFNVVALEAYYRLKQLQLIDGVISPNNNVATVENGARLINGIWPQFLLKEDIKNYDLSSGYKIGSGRIAIQLKQPYYLNSMSLLLWDQDERKYSFYIETSTNQKDWEIAVDIRNKQLGSWQKFTFESREVVFIRIIGTHNTATANASTVFNSNVQAHCSKNVPFITMIIIISFNKQHGE